MWATARFGLVLGETKNLDLVWFGLVLKSKELIRIEQKSKTKLHRYQNSQSSPSFIYEFFKNYLTKFSLFKKFFLSHSVKSCRMALLQYKKIVNFFP